MGQSCSVADAGVQLLAGDSSAPAPSNPTSAPAQASAPRSWNVSCFPIRVEGFRISHCRRTEKGPDGPGWRRAYTQGEKLGTGATANVFEAETGSWAIFGCGRRAPRPILCVTEGVGSSSRRVALKRFKSTCDEAFRMELKALSKVGVHPNIVRLLEDYQGFRGEKVLVYEFCDGLTLWDLFLSEIRSNATSTRAVFIARVLQQMLLALEHINACDVEHRDVKPENIFLSRVCVAENRVDLKLGDFGWAVVGGTTELPPQGAGSLWYAPPELNPPVDLSCDSSSTTAPSTPSTLDSIQADRPDRKTTNTDLHRKLHPFGKADIWSSGVILYVLLVGHNPFQAALNKDKAKSIEQEVLRLVARGQLDDTCDKWMDVDSDAKDLICSMIQVTAQRRPAPTEALRHPYLIRSLARSGDRMQAEPAWRRATREDSWAQLDGFQRLGWVAVARAVGEPELVPEVVSLSLRAVRARTARGAAGSPDTAYLLQLAQEISALPKSEWLQDLGAWEEVLRLAFSYLDIDGDDLLSLKDLASLVEAPSAAEAEQQVHSWMSRWHVDTGGAAFLRKSCLKGLTKATLRAALTENWSADESRGTEDGLMSVPCVDLSHMGWAGQDASRQGRPYGCSEPPKFGELANT